MAAPGTCSWSPSWSSEPIRNSLEKIPAKGPPRVTSPRTREKATFQLILGQTCRRASNGTNLGHSRWGRRQGRQASSQITSNPEVGPRRAKRFRSRLRGLKVRFWIVSNFAPIHTVRTVNLRRLDAIDRTYSFTHIRETGEQGRWKNVANEPAA